MRRGAYNKVKEGHSQTDKFSTSIAVDYTSTFFEILLAGDTEWWT